MACSGPCVSGANRRHSESVALTRGVGMNYLDLPRPLHTTRTEPGLLGKVNGSACPAAGPLRRGAPVPRRRATQRQARVPYSTIRLSRPSRSGSMDGSERATPGTTSCKKLYSPVSRQRTSGPSTLSLSFLSLSLNNGSGTRYSTPLTVHRGARVGTYLSTRYAPNWPL